MAARRCPIHGIDYPADHRTCDVCGETLSYETRAAPDTDWQEQVRALRGGGEGERREAWRLKQLLDLGVPVHQAEELAARRDVDCLAIRELVRRGCPLQTAIRIIT